MAITLDKLFSKDTDNDLKRTVRAELRAKFKQEIRHELTNYVEELERNNPSIVCFANKKPRKKSRHVDLNWFEGMCNEG